jgi:hypothetical protein
LFQNAKTIQKNFILVTLCSILFFVLNISQNNVFATDNFNVAKVNSDSLKEKKEYTSSLIIYASKNFLTSKTPNIKHDIKDYTEKLASDILGLENEWTEEMISSFTKRDYDDDNLKNILTASVKKDFDDAFKIMSTDPLGYLNDAFVGIFSTQLNSAISRLWQI